MIALNLKTDLGPFPTTEPQWEWLPLVCSMPLAFGLSRLFRKCYPDWSDRRLVLCSALPGFVIILCLGALAVAYIVRQPASPGEIDSGGMAIVAIIGITPIYASVVLLVGAVTARLSLHRR